MPTVDDDICRSAVKLLLEAAPGATVIVFGSYARGDVQPGSDLDLLVVEPQVGDRYAEMSRLAQALAHLRVAIDVLVVSTDQFRYWRDTPNTVYHRAAREGRAYEQVA